MRVRGSDAGEAVTGYGDAGVVVFASASVGLEDGGVALVVGNGGVTWLTPCRTACFRMEGLPCRRRRPRREAAAMLARARAAGRTGRRGVDDPWKAVRVTAARGARHPGCRPSDRPPHAACCRSRVARRPGAQAANRRGRRGVGAGADASESSVAAMLAAGHTLREIAGATGRREGTIRWHLKHIFAKHGISRQADVCDCVDGAGRRGVRAEQARVTREWSRCHRSRNSRGCPGRC